MAATVTQNIGNEVASSLEQAGVGIDPLSIITMILGFLKALGICGQTPAKAYRMTKIILFGGWYPGVNLHRAMFDRNLTEQYGDDAPLVKAGFKDAFHSMTMTTFTEAFTEAQQAA